MNPDSHKCLKIVVHGIVQGVGFRPFVYNLATGLGIKGTVSNTTHGVEIFISGSKEQTEKFLEGLTSFPPPLAKIGKIELFPFTDVCSDDGFRILESHGDGQPPDALIPPDIATCSQCVSEIKDPGNRRYDYPFTNCTNCGPRFTIITSMPYDRANTSMSSFSMCKACLKEYHSPEDRRFHAQPNACPRCGPVLSWHDSKGSRLEVGNSICLDLCASALKEGHIVAIKGLGGFHLAVNAQSEEAVMRLRKLKRRPEKPLAIMVPDMDRARRCARINKLAEKVLCSMHAPIVLAEKIPGVLPHAIAPGINEIGLMMAYTPLHHLLFARADCPEFLVMTSGNRAGEPICITNDGAVKRLGGIADFFLMHNREIVNRADDSVVRIINEMPAMIRRSRGYAPVPVQLKGLSSNSLSSGDAGNDSSGLLLACGAELKNTFALCRGDQLFLSQHIGDLKSPAVYEFFRHSIQNMQALLEITPGAVVCDMHPDYLSSRYAKEQGIAVTEVQHHHAHAGAVMAEHGIEEAVAVIFDGTGYGPDVTVWGGEFFYVNKCNFQRLGHILPIPMPGGDAAASQPWRMALSLLLSAGFHIDGNDSRLPQAILEIPVETRMLIARIVQQKINTPWTSSVGRLFDAVAALTGMRSNNSFEAQAAMELEAAAFRAVSGRPAVNHAPVGCCRWKSGTLKKSDTVKENNLWIIDSRIIVPLILDDMKQGVPSDEIALDFHLWLVKSSLELIKNITQTLTVRNIILGGGCFQNRLLSEFMSITLENSGYRVYTGKEIPVNDGGISAGQIYLAKLS